LSAFISEIRDRYRLVERTRDEDFAARLVMRFVGLLALFVPPDFLVFGF
jgi:nitrogen fixation/metabolism regulation signal transduction histidine kinase